MTRSPFRYLCLSLAGITLVPALFLLGADGTAGRIEGRIVFPDEKEGKAPPGVVLQDALVWLEGDGLVRKDAPPPGEAEMDQVDITYVPHVLPVVAGTTVIFKNSDKIMHNIHTKSVQNEPFNSAQLPKKILRKLYEKPEIVHVGCDVHSQMSAYIVVLPNPVFARASKDGAYVLPDLPPGHYRLVAWHERYGKTESEVEVTVGGALQKDIGLKTPKEENK